MIPHIGWGISCFYDNAHQVRNQLLLWPDIIISVRHGCHGRHGRQIKSWDWAFGRHLTEEIFRCCTSPPKTSDGHLTVNGQQKKNYVSHNERLKLFCFIALSCAKSTHFICNVLSHKYTYGKVFTNYNCVCITKWAIGETWLWRVLQTK